MKRSEPAKPGLPRPFGLVVSHSVLITLFLGLLASTLCSLLAHQIIRREESQRFEMALQEVDDLVKARFEGLLGVLQHTRAFFTTKERVSRQDFRIFVQSIDLPHNFPEVLGVGFDDRITAIYRAAHERDVREDGYPRYGIWPTPEKNVNYLYPIKFLEPFNFANRRALGFDMHTEVRRAAAMDRARDSAKPALSSRVNLLQDKKGMPATSLLFFLPVYKRGFRVASPQERRWALQGFLFATIRASDFFHELFRTAPVFRGGIGLRAFSGPPSSASALFDSSESLPKGEKTNSSLYANHIVSLYGQQWTLQTFATRGFASSADRYAPIFVFLSGLLITLLACCVTYVTGRQAESQRDRAASEQAARELLQASAREREGSLRIQERLLRIAQVVSAELDLEKVAQAVTDAATSLSGASMGSFLFGLDGEDEGDARFTVSGISPKSYANKPTQNPSIFFASIAAGRAIRHDDISLAPALSHPIFDFGHRVRSYLAVPVISRSGDVIGGILLAHEKAGIFGEREEKVVVGLAAQAAIAIDNARLFRKSHEAIETRDEFLSICSHELRTPLTSMKLQNQLAQRTLISGLSDSGARARFEKMVQQSGKQIDRLVRLIEEMLDISRIRSGKLSLTPERLDLTQLVEDTVERFLPQMQEARCQVNITAPPSLVGSWDRLRLEQILVNLLSNATKYGAGKPIHVTLSREGGVAVLCVRDEGIGIARKHQARIFERFERAVSKAEISGLGLGLYIVKKILELQGGHIRVESVPGKGSRFIVELPLEPQIETATPLQFPSAPHVLSRAEPIHISRS